MWDENRAFRDNRTSDYGLQNALSDYVRRKWPVKTCQHVEQFFRVTPCVAKKIVDAQASRAAINDILRDPRHLALSLELVCAVAGTSMEGFIQQQAKEAARERAQWEARERSLEIMQARVAERHRLDRVNAL